MTESTLDLLESLVGGLKERFPFLRNYPLIPIPCKDSSTIDVFQSGPDRILAYEWSDDNM